MAVSEREFDQLRARVDRQERISDEHDDRLNQVDALIVRVDLMTDTFRSLKVIGTGLIVLVLGSALAIVYFGGPPGG